MDRQLTGQFLVSKTEMVARVRSGWEVRVQVQSVITTPTDVMWWPRFMAGTNTIICNAGSCVFLTLLAFS